MAKWDGQRKRRLTAVLIGVMVVLLAASCGGRQNQPTNDTGVVVTAQPAATAVGETELRITLTAADGRPVSGAAVQARGDMSHAGMVPVLRTALPGDAGVYTAPFEWTMAGDWVLTVEFTLADGRTGTETFDFSIPTP